MSPGGGSGDVVSPTAIDHLPVLHLAGRLGAPGAGHGGVASARRLGEPSQRPGVALCISAATPTALAALTGLRPARSTHCLVMARRAQPAPGCAIKRTPEVTMLDVYRRQPARIGIMDVALAGPGVDAVALTSSEAVDWLFMLVASRAGQRYNPCSTWRLTRALPSAAECGASRCLITAADNDALVAALCEWFETRP